MSVFIEVQKPGFGFQTLSIWYQCLFAVGVFQDSSYLLLLFLYIFVTILIFFCTVLLSLEADLFHAV